MSINNKLDSSGWTLFHQWCNHIGIVFIKQGNVDGGVLPKNAVCIVVKSLLHGNCIECVKVCMKHTKNYGRIVRGLVSKHPFH